MSAALGLFQQMPPRRTPRRPLWAMNTTQSEEVLATVPYGIGPVLGVLQASILLQLLMMQHRPPFGDPRPGPGAPRPACLANLTDDRERALAICRGLAPAAAAVDAVSSARPTAYPRSSW